MKSCKWKTYTLTRTRGGDEMRVIISPLVRDRGAVRQTERDDLISVGGDEEGTPRVPSNSMHRIFIGRSPSTQRQTKERFSVTELTKKQKTKKKHCAKWERRRPSQLLWEILELKMALIKTRVLLSRAQKCFFLAVCLPRLGTAPFFRCFSFESPFHRGSERLGGCVDLIN